MAHAYLQSFAIGIGKKIDEREESHRENAANLGKRLFPAAPNVDQSERWQLPIGWAPLPARLTTSRSGATQSLLSIVGQAPCIGQPASPRLLSIPMDGQWTRQVYNQMFCLVAKANHVATG